MDNKIGIDIGHNLACDVGASAYKNEDGLNLLVVNLVICKLREKGFDVVNCTPGAANSLGDSLSQRCNIDNTANVDLFISIHHNAGGGEVVEVSVYKDDLVS